MKKIALLLGVGYLSGAIAAEPVQSTAISAKKSLVAADNTKEMPEMTVTDANPTNRLFPNTSKAIPSYTVDALDIKTKINTTTSEDTLRYSPSVLIRKRYMGNSNGTLGIRGSNSFQTAHSMVYGDGMPLHNPLRTSFSGAPRWSMVSPSEIETSEVLYGPFSAQYSGNSMGGVVNLITKMPDKFEAQVDAMGMFQTMHRSGRNDTLSGFKTFLSAGDRFDKFSIWGSYNHFENEAQPQTINAAAQTNLLPTLPNAFRAGISPFLAQAALPIANGGENYQLATAAPAIAYGDIGTSQPITDLYKMKMGYDFTEDLQGRFTFAYENRQDTVDNPNSLLKNANGTTNWGGATVATKANPNGGGMRLKITRFHNVLIL